MQRKQSVVRIAFLLIITVISLLPLTAAKAVSTTYTVGDGSNGETYTTINAALAVAGDGDTILVSDGTYTETIDYGGKGITIQSVNGAATTTIDANSTGSAVTFSNSESASSVLDGFTITGGTGTGNSGGGIYCSATSPTIQNCIITGNDVIANGGGIYTNGASATPTIIDCTIKENTADIGGGISVDGSLPTIERCEILKNSASGQTSNIGGGLAIFGHPSTMKIRNCTIADNTATMWGGGILVSATNLIWFINCTLSNNTAGGNGGGLATIANTPNMVIFNSIFYGNSAASGNSIYTNNSTTINFGYSVINFSDVVMAGGGGYTNDFTINSDPLFIDDTNATILSRDYHLSIGSPCIDTGSDNSGGADVPNDDIDGDTRPITSLYDMGSDEAWWTFYTDADGDGYGDSTDSGVVMTTDPGAGYSTNKTDCDDTAATVNPGATETADDGIDQNCNGYDLVTFYIDSDGDGYGTAVTTTQRDDGTTPTGYVTNSTDCDDTDAARSPATVWYKDSDGDGYSDGTTQTSCFRPAGHKLASELTATSGDCDDTASCVYPGATEIAGDDIDQDCDGSDLIETPASSGSSSSSGGCFIAEASYEDTRAIRFIDKLIGLMR